MIYPITIIATRYGGAYESGRWAAFACDPDEVPMEAYGDDIDCAYYWENCWASGPVNAVGSSPGSAITQLDLKMKGRI